MKEKTLLVLVGEWREFLSGADEKEMDAFVWPQERDGPQVIRRFLLNFRDDGEEVIRGRQGRLRKEARIRME